MAPALQQKFFPNQARIILLPYALHNPACRDVDWQPGNILVPRTVNWSGGQEQFKVITMAMYANVRRMFFREKLSISEI